MNTRQIPGRDKIGSLTPGKYTQFEGTDITVDNCLRSRVRDLRIEGKTIQDTEDLSNIESVAEREENVLSISINSNRNTITLPQPLRSLPNGVRDTIEGDKLVQRVGHITFTGYEMIGDQISNYNRIQIKVSNCKEELVRNVIVSDKFNYIIGSQDVNTAFSYGGQIYMYLGFTTKEEYKAWIIENKPTFYYELAEPIVHDLTIPSIYTEKGTNIITTENNIKPKLSMKVKVKK